MAESQTDKNNISMPAFLSKPKSEWLWTDFAQYLAMNAKDNGHSSDGDMSLFPKVCYTYAVLRSVLKDCEFDSDDYAFPFTDDTLRAIDGVQYSGYFGEPRSNHTHKGIDLATGDGNFSEIRAIADGEVTSGGTSDNGWGSNMNGICIQHDTGIFARYLHCSEVFVHKGDKVSKGDVIGKVGGYGDSGPNTYAVHLHLECGKGNAESTQANIDPISLYPSLMSIPKGSMIKP